MFNSEQEAAHWLAGIIDGEGHVTNSKYQRRVVITNTDRKIVDAVEAACGLLDIDVQTNAARQRSDRHKPHWIITIAKQDNLKTLRRVITLRSDKEARLDELLASYKRAPYRY